MSADILGWMPLGLAIERLVDGLVEAKKGAGANRPQSLGGGEQTVAAQDRLEKAIPNVTTTPETVRLGYALAKL